MNKQKRSIRFARVLKVSSGILVLAFLQLGCREILTVAHEKSKIVVDGDASDWNTYPRYFFENAGVSIAFVNSDSMLYCLVQRRFDTDSPMTPITLWFDDKGGTTGKIGLLLSAGPTGGRGMGRNPGMNAGENGEPAMVPGQGMMQPGQRPEMMVKSGIQSQAVIRYGDNLRTDIEANGTCGLLWANGLRKDVLVQEFSIPLGSWSGFDEFGQTTRLALNAKPGMKIRASISYVQMPTRQMQGGPGGMGGGPGGGMVGGGMGGGGMSGPPPGGMSGGRGAQGGNRQLSESRESINLKLAK